MAAGQLMVSEPKDGKALDRLCDAVEKAECRVAETMPTTLNGLAWSAQWFRRFIERHDGAENIIGHEALETWPRTICEAFKAFRLRPDPVDQALSCYRTAVRAFNESNAPEGSEEHKRLERDSLAALARLEKTIPVTGHGLATALEAFLQDDAEYRTGMLSAGQVEWFKRLTAAARALS